MYFNITFYVALTVLHYFYIKLPCSFGQAFERTSKGHGFKPHLYPELKNPNVAIDVCIYVFVYIYIYIYTYIYILLRYINMHIYIHIYIYKYIYIYIYNTYYTESLNQKLCQWFIARTLKRYIGGWLSRQQIFL